MFLRNHGVDQNVIDDIENKMSNEKEKIKQQQIDNRQEWQIIQSNKDKLRNMDKAVEDFDIQDDKVRSNLDNLICTRDELIDRRNELISKIDKAIPPPNQLEQLQQGFAVMNKFIEKLQMVMTNGPDRVVVCRSP